MIKMATFIIILLVFLTQNHLRIIIIYDLLVLLFPKYRELTEATRAVCLVRTNTEPQSCFQTCRNRRNGGGLKAPGGRARHRG